MTEFFPFDVFMALLVTMGPLKVMLVYAELTRDLDKPTRRRIAFKAVLIAFIVGLVHGGAGSAAAVLLVLSMVEVAWQGVLLIFLFGLGVEPGQPQRRAGHEQERGQPCESAGDHGHERGAATGEPQQSEPRHDRERHRHQQDAGDPVQERVEGGMAHGFLGFSSSTSRSFFLSSWTAFLSMPSK